MSPQPDGATSVATEETEIALAPERAAAAETTGSVWGVAGRALWQAFSPLIVSFAVAVVAWEAFLRIFDINPLVGKSPAAVWEYLVTDPEAATNRTDVFDPLTQTLVDASYGFVLGMTAAVLIAISFVLYPAAEQAFMPVAMLLRSVPLVAMTPIITLIFGRGVAGVAIIGAIVVLFPALVTIVFGLRSVHPQTRDLVLAYGGGKATVLRKVSFPTALPAIFAAARISVPGAIIGALVAEWLATGQGTGGAILRDIGAFRYDHLWASIVMLTAVSVLLYTLVGLLEQFVLARFGPAPEA